MKINIKVLIICILIILSVIPSAYAYWTDKVNTEINLIITYDAMLNILNIPVPEPPPVEEIPTQIEEIPSPVENTTNITGGSNSPETDTVGGNSSDINSDNSASSDVETEDANGSNVNSDNSGSSDVETEGGNISDLDSDNSNSDDTKTDESENNINFNSDNDIESEDITDNHVENE